MTTPAITVLMPVYNAELYLREAIESILNQTFRDFEFLIINDGSTDTSESIILSYKDPRIRYIKNGENLKLIATLNKGIEMARGEYIVRMDADDVSLPHRLRVQFDFMESNPKVGLSGTGFEIFGEGLPKSIVQYSADHETICLKHLYQIHLSHGTSIFRMSVLRQNNLLFDPSFVHAEDYELWTRVSRVSKLANIQKVLYRVRHHQNEVSKLHSDIQRQNSFRVKQQQFLMMGLELSEIEIDLFARISQHEYRKDKNFIVGVKKLLEKLVIANNLNEIIEKKFFNKAIGNFWLNVTYNCTSVGMFAFKEFFSSTLHKQKNLKLSEKVFFFIKSLLRI